MEHLTEAELQNWIDRELDPAERSRVSRHLEGCGTCRSVVAELRAAAETFSAAMLRYDDALAAEAGVTPGGAPPPFRPHEGAAGLRAVPRWVGRAAALVLLLGAAAAAAMVPGSPLRDLLVAPEPELPVAPPAELQPAAPELVSAASITLRPQEGVLTVRIRNFAPGTRVKVSLTDRAEAVASLPDGAPNARFVVASATLDVIGAGVPAAELDGMVEVRLPRSLQAGAVELDGATVAQVTAGRLITLRQVSRTGDEAVFEVGG